MRFWYLSVIVIADIAHKDGSLKAPKRGSLKTALQSASESALQTAPKSALKIIEQISNNPRATMTVDELCTATKSLHATMKL